MPYVTSWERIAKKEGMKEGKRETARELVERSRYSYYRGGHRFFPGRD